MGDDRAVRYIETIDGEEVVVYRASGLGGCTRMFVALANGYPMAKTPDWMREVWDEGHAFEDQIRTMWAAENGSEVVDDQLEVELDLGEMHGRRVIVRGHIDGVEHEAKGGTGGSPPVLFEAKKFRDSTWSKFQQSGIECNVNYPWQVSVYMHGLGLDECNFVGGHLIENDEGVRELVEVEAKRIPAPPFSLAAIRKRIAEIEKLIDTGFDAREVDCNKSMFPCPAFKLHDWDEDEPFVFPAEDDEANEAIRKYVAAHQEAAANKKIADALDKKKREAGDELRRVIAERGGDAEAAKKFEGAGFTFTRTRKHIAEHTRKASDQDFFTSVKEGRRMSTSELPPEYPVDPPSTPAPTVADEQVTVTTTTRETTTYFATCKFCGERYQGTTRDMAVNMAVICIHKNINNKDT